MTNALEPNVSRITLFLLIITLFERGDIFLCCRVVRNKNHSIFTSTALAHIVQKVVLNLFSTIISSKNYNSINL